MLCHSFVIGELAYRNLRRRAGILALLRALPELPVLASEDAVAFLVAHRLMGEGLGWADRPRAGASAKQLAGSKARTADPAATSGPLPPLSCLNRVCASARRGHTMPNMSTPWLA